MLPYCNLFEQKKKKICCEVLFVYLVLDIEVVWSVNIKSCKKSSEHKKC